MNKIQFTEQSLNKYPHHPHDQISNSININSKKSRQKQRDKQLSSMSKQNESKHMNAIKPYVIQGKQRKISKRDSQKNITTNSPYLPQSNNVSGCGNLNENNSRPKIKKAEPNSKHLQQSVNAKNKEDLYHELITIKAEYKSLKNSYNGLIKHNSDLTQRGQREANQVIELTRQIEKLKREEQKNKSNIRFTQQQLQRIKKQCVRMVQAQKFKNKKLEETIQQKQLMIAYLRNQLAILNGQSTQTHSNFFFQHTAPTYIRSTHSNLINIQNLNNPISQGNRYAFSQKDIEGQNNKTKILNIPGSSINLPIGPQAISSNRVNFSQINKSLVNHSAISSIQNNSMIAISELVDLPRQMNQKIMKQRDNIFVNDTNNKYLLESEIKIMQERQSFRAGIQQNKKKRQYIFSNQDDSLSFSYQKSKQSLFQNQHDSIQSLNDPTILTFTKKDVYVLDGNEEDADHPNNLQENQHNCSFSQQFQADQNKSSIIIVDKSQISKIKQIKPKVNQQSVIGSDYVHEFDESDQDYQKGSNEQKISYTGQQQLMTFQNRKAEKNLHDNLFKIINPHIKFRDNKKEQKDSKLKNRRKQKIVYNKQSGEEKKQITSKSKLHTKRLQIFVDQINGNNEGKESSAQTKKRHINHEIINSKTGKKKLSKKRKSQQCSGSLIKK